MPETHNMNLEFQENGLRELSQRLSSVEKATSKASLQISEFSHNIQQSGRQAKNAFKSLFDTALISKFGESITKFNKQLFDIGQTARITGQSFFSLRNDIDETSKATRLSRSEAAHFFKSIQDGTQGIKLTAHETAEFAKTLSKAFGPSLRNVQDAMNTLMGIQHREINVLRRINQGFTTQELGAYTAALIQAHGASEKEVEVLMRTAMARSRGAQAVTEEQQRLRQLSDTVQSLRKAGENLLLKFGEPMADAMNKLGDSLKNVMKWFEEMAENEGVNKLLKLAPYIMGGAVAAGGAGAIALGVKATKNLFTSGNQRGLPQRGLSGPGAPRDLSSMLGARAIRVRVVNWPGGSGLEDLGGEPGRGRRRRTRTGRRRFGATRTPSFGSEFKRSVVGIRGLPGRAWRGAGNIASKIGGFASRRLAGIGGVAPWSIAGGVAGMAAGYAGQTLAKHGHERIGGVLSTLGGVATQAASGAAMGSIFGPLGTVIGGVAGAAKGLWDNFDQLEEAVTGVTIAQRKQKEAIQKRAIESIRKSGVTDPSQWLKRNYKSIQGQFGGKAFEKLSESQQQQALHLDKMVSNIEKSVGVSRSDKVGLAAGAVQLTLAQKAAKQVGLKGESAQKEISNYLRGLPSAITEAMGKIMKKPGAVKRASAMIPGQIKGMTAGVDVEKLSDAIKGIRMNAMVRAFQEVGRQTRQISQYVQAIVSGNQQIIEYQQKFGNDLTLVNKLYDESIGALDTEIELLKDMQKHQDELMNDKQAQNEYEKKIDDTLKSQISSESMRRQIKSKLLMDMKSEKSISVPLAAAESQRSMALIQQGVRNKEIVNTKQAEIDLMESQLDMVKAMYLGLGPTLDMQLKLVGALRGQNQELSKQVKDLKSGEGFRRGEPAVLQKILHIENKITRNRTKALNITRNLREGYLDAIQSFKNVEGAFGKIILDRNLGMGEIMRQFKAPGGIRTGKTGAGATRPVAEWHPGGRLQFAGPQQFYKMMQNYEAWMTPLSGVIGTAAAEKESGAAPYLQQLSAARQTGMPTGQAVSGPTALEMMDKMYGGMGAGGGAVATMTSKNNIIGGSENAPKTSVTMHGQKPRDLEGGGYHNKVIELLSSILESIKKTRIQIGNADKSHDKSAKDSNTITKEMVKKKSKKDDESRKLAVKKNSEHANKLASKKIKDDEGIKRVLKKNSEHTSKLASKKKPESANVKKYDIRKTLTKALQAKMKAWVRSIKNNSSDKIMDKFKQEAQDAHGVAIAARRWAATFKHKLVQAGGRGRGRARMFRRTEGGFTGLEKSVLGNHGPFVFGSRKVIRRMAPHAARSTARNHPGATRRGSPNLASAITSAVKKARRFTPISNAKEKGMTRDKLLAMSEAFRRENEEKDKSSTEKARKAVMAEGRKPDVNVAAFSAKQAEARLRVSSQAVKEGKATENRIRNKEEKENKEAFKKRAASMISDAKLDVSETGMDKFGIGKAKVALHKAMGRYRKIVPMANEEEQQKAEHYRNEASKQLTTIFKKYGSRSNALREMPDKIKILESKMDKRTSTERSLAENLYGKRWKNLNVIERSKGLKYSTKIIGSARHKAMEARRKLEEKQEAARSYIKNVKSQASNLGAKPNVKLSDDQIALTLRDRPGTRGNEEEDDGVKDVREAIEKGTDSSNKQLNVMTEMSKTSEAHKKVAERTEKEGASWRDSEAKRRKEAVAAVVAATAAGGKGGENDTYNQAMGAAKQRVRVMETGFIGIEKAVLGGSGPIRFHFARGGRVAGEGDSDNVPALLTPGEMVINKHASKAHRGLLERLNSNQFSTGGIVPPLSMASSGGSFAPKFSFNIRGDSVNTILKAANGALAKQLNNMMTPSGTAGRFFDLPNSG